MPVVYVDLEPEEEALVLATLDPIGAMATRDDARLQELLSGLVVDDAGLVAMLGGLRMPDFGPISEDEQGRLDQKAPVTCPECGHVFQV